MEIFINIEFKIIIIVIILLFISLNLTCLLADKSDSYDIFCSITLGITIKNKIKVIPDTNVPDYIKQAIIGLLLGDGTLVKKYSGIKAGTYFKFAQGEVHYSYLLHVFDLFHKAKLCNMLEPVKGFSFNKKNRFNL